MPIIKLNGTQLEVDENGYITDPSLWNEDLAILLAKHAEGIIELTKNH
jgi:tRNA 2-thiouridine synthesizing protein E